MRIESSRDLRTFGAILGLVIAAACTSPPALTIDGSSTTATAAAGGVAQLGSREAEGVEAALDGGPVAEVQYALPDTVIRGPRTRP
jgi:hypothetical protein